MFGFLKHLFRPRPPEGAWRLSFIRDDNGEKVDLGTFVGSAQDAFDELEHRQVNWFFFKSGAVTEHYVFSGKSLLEPINCCSKCGDWEHEGRCPTKLKPRPDSL